MLEVIPEKVYTMLAYYEDWPAGNPVATGEAHWLPRQFRQAMHEIRFAMNEQTALVRERAKARRHG